MKAWRVAVVVLGVTALAACDVELEGFDIFGDGGFSFGDGGLWGSECSTDEQCGAGRCCSGLFARSCRDTVQVEAGQPLCNVFGDGGESCICTFSSSSSICPGPFNEPPFESECPASATTCLLSVVQGGCFCQGEEIPDVPPGWTLVSSCPPPSWDGADAGVSAAPDAG